MTLLAGAAQVDIRPAPGCELMGYGARDAPSTGVHDPLHARALWLGMGDSSPAPGGVLLVSADLCLIAPEQAEDVRRGIGDRTGLDPSRILVGCTHTHSGPDTGLGALRAGRPAPEHVAQVFQGCIDAGVSAVTCAEPARMGWSRAEARIGRNRRLADGPLDPRLLVLRVEAEDGRPLCVLFHHACHGTVLGHENLEISADWPGVAAARIREQTGAVAIFLLGAHADIDPRTRGLMDLAIPGQSIGLGFEAVRVLGLEVAEAVLDALTRPAEHEGGPIAAARRTLRLPLHLGELSPQEARAELERRKGELAGRLGLAPEELPRLAELSGFVEQRVRERPLAEARSILSQARLWLRDKTGPFFTGGQRSLDVEVQVLRLGAAALLGLPLEPTTQVGLDWAERARGRAPLAGVCGIANGWLRYLPHPEDLAHPLAGQHYEVLMSTFAPGACERLLDAGQELLVELG